MALGALIFIHELGHFLVAKAMGVGVERFSLGFGPRIFSFRRGETEYCISIVPLGGYVKMTGRGGARGGRDPPDDRRARRSIRPSRSRSKPLWARALIVFAGPGMNFVLAAVIFSIVFAVGRGARARRRRWGGCCPTPRRPRRASGPGTRSWRSTGGRSEHWGELEEAVARVGRAGRSSSPSSATARRQDVTVTPRKVPARTPFNEPAEAWSIGARPYLPPVVGEVRAGHAGGRGGAPAARPRRGASTGSRSRRGTSWRR